MKNTIICLGVLVSILGLSKEVKALVPLKSSEIELKVTLIPTATPSPVIYKKIDPNKIDLKLLPTVTATATPKEVVVTRVVTQMISPTIEVSPTNKVEENKVEESKTGEKTENNIKDIFTKITLGLLALIIIIQVWPKKKKDNDK